MKTKFAILFITMLPMVILAQEVEIGLRFNPDILLVRDYSRVRKSHENVWNYDPFVLHTLIALRVNKYVIPELRIGYALVGPYDGWEVGLIFKSEVVKDLLYLMACDWFHWNRGGYGSMRRSTYETLFNAPGIGFGLRTGTHWSLEVMFLKPFGGDLGYDWDESFPDPEGKKPTRLLAVIRAGIGFSLRP